MAFGTFGIVRLGCSGTADEWLRGWCIGSDRRTANRHEDRPRRCNIVTAEPHEDAVSVARGTHGNLANRSGAGVTGE